MLPHATDRDPTRLFGTYNTVATLAGALGALAAGGPTLLHTGSSRWLLAYPAAAVLCVPVAAGISRGGRAGRRARRRAARCTARAGSSTGSQRCSRSTRSAAASSSRPSSPTGSRASSAPRPRRSALVFFCVAILQALSFQAAVRLAGRIGLLPTMVFTHLPSNVLLALIPFMPNAGAGRSGCCSPASRSRRWTCPRGRPTSSASSTRASGRRRPRTPTPPAT